MPIHECKLPDGGDGYQWGNHGKCYPTREEAEKQAEAAHANGYTGDDFSNFFTTTQISGKKSLTPEGFLLCEEVPIARTGSMVYAGGEIPIEPGEDGLIWITRDESVLFSQDTMNSFLGKAVTNNHPKEGVTPLTWKDVSVGTAHNIRRGSGILNDCLVADLLITDMQAIEDVMEGKREVSAGYDADYVQLSAGRGQQRQIIGNHIALVEKGRCGPRCSIGDKAMADKQPSWKDKVKDRLKAVLSNDEATKVLEMIPEAEVPSIHIHTSTSDSGVTKDADPLTQIMSRLNTLDAAVKKLTEDAEGEEEEERKKKEEEEKATKDKKTKDADKDDDDDDEDHENMTEDSFAALRSMAEILAPGMKVEKTCDSYSGCVRAVLGKAYAMDKAKGVIDVVLAGRKPTFDSMPKGVVKTVFNGAVAIMKERNNKPTMDAVSKTVQMNRDVNKRNQDFWTGRGVRY